MHTQNIPVSIYICRSSIHGFCYLWILHPPPPAPMETIFEGEPWEKLPLMSCILQLAFYKLEAAFVLIGWMRRGAGDYLYPGPKNAKNQRRWLNFPIWYNFVIKFEFEILQHIIILFNLDVHTYLVSPNATFILITKMKRPISYQTKVSCFL